MNLEIDYSIFNVKDIIWDENGGMLCFELRDSNGKQYFSPVEATYNEPEYTLGVGKKFLLSDWNACIAKYGQEEMNNVMRSDIHIGMDSALVRLSAGNPYINRFAKLAFTFSVANPKANAGIVAYYENHIDDILNQAQSYASNGQYDEAIATLLSVPESCRPQYVKAIKKSEIYYQQKINSEGAALLNTAKSIWHSSQTKESAESASSYLSQINPSAACYPEAKQLYKQIGQKVDYINEKQREFERKQYEDEQKRLLLQEEYEQQRKMETIRALKEVGTALCSRPITYNYYPVYWW